MLTLGELVLAVTAILLDSVDFLEFIHFVDAGIPILNYVKAVRFSGFVLVVGMLYMLVIAQPDTSHDHPFSRGVGFKILYQAFFLIICTIMPLVGTMLELAVRKPIGFVGCPVQTRILHNLFSTVVLGVLGLHALTLRLAGVRTGTWWWHLGRCRATWRKLALWTCRFVLIFSIVALWGILAMWGIPPYSQDSRGGWWTVDAPEHSRDSRSIPVIHIYMLVVCFAVIVWLNVLVTHLQLRESEAHPTPSGVPAEPAISPVQSPLSSPGSSFTHGHGEQAACAGVVHDD